MAKELTKDMTKGTPWKLIMAFFIPLLVGNCFQQLYNIIDSIVVGKGINDEALAAVGATGSLHFFIFGFVIGLTSGISILISQAYGAQDMERLRKVISMSLIVSIVLIVVFTIVCVWQLTPLLEIMKTPKGVIMEQAKAYMNIILYGLFATIFYNYLAGLLRALGDSKTPLLAMILSTVVNVVLDLFFILVLHMGVEGAAYATVIAQIFTVVFCFIKVRKITFIKLKREDFTMNGKVIGEILKIGLPVGFMNSITAVGFMVLQYFVNGLGETYTAAYSVGTKIFTFVEQPSAALGLAVTTYAGQNLGANKIRRIKTGVYSTLFISVIMNLGIGLVMVLIPDILARIMVSKPENIRLASEFIPIGGYGLIFLSVLFTFRGACQGMGHTVVPMISGILELALRVFIVLAIGSRFGMLGIGLTEISAWFGAGAMLMGYFVWVLRVKMRNYVEV